MTDTPPEVPAMARRIVAGQSAIPDNQKKALEGGMDGYFITRIAIQAILETTEAAADKMECCGEPCHQCIDALRNFDHLKGPEPKKVYCSEDGCHRTEDCGPFCRNRNER